MKNALSAIILVTFVAIAVPVKAEEIETAAVEVEFINPQKYTDADYGPGYRKAQGEEIFRQLRRHLQKQAPRYLEPGQRLRMQFTDIDLAGDREPNTRIDLHDVRIIRSVYPPKLSFHFQLLDSTGIVIREDDVAIRDIGFDMHLHTPASDSLRYEKHILTEWLQRELGRS